MADVYSKSILKIAVAQMCQAVGFESVHGCTLDVLKDILERYLHSVGKLTHDFAEQSGHSNVHTNDVLQSFHHMNISLPELGEYMQQMEDVKPAVKPKKFPLSKKSNFQFNNSKLPSDMEHIYSYFPSLLPTAETEKVPEKAEVVSNPQKKMFFIAGKDDLSDNDDRGGGYSSDDSVTNASSDARYLTRPEDIPTISGTAPSSLPAYVPPQLSLPKEESRRLSTQGNTYSRKSPDSKYQRKISSGENSKSNISKSSDKNDEPSWIKNYAAKWEHKSESKKNFSSPVPSNKAVENRQRTPSHERKKPKTQPAELKSSLWDDPIFTRPKSSVTSKTTKNAFNRVDSQEKPEKSYTKINKPKHSISHRIEEVDRLLQYPIAEKETKSSTDFDRVPSTSVVSPTPLHHASNQKVNREGNERWDQPKDHGLTFASPKSVEDAITAVVNRAKKEAEEAEVNKFSHLISDSSSSDEDFDEAEVSHKTEELLQLGMRGLNQYNEEDSPVQPPPTPSPALSPSSMIIDDEEEEKDFDDDPYDEPSPFPDLISEKVDSPALSFNDDLDNDDLPDYSIPPVIIKPPQPESKKLKKLRKEEKAKAKAKKLKHKLKNKHNKSFESSSSVPKVTPQSVEKLILKKSKVGDAKVVKIHKERNIVSPPIVERELPVPKLSAALSVPSSYPPFKEKKKDKKEKKKKKDKDLKLMKKLSKDKDKEKESKKYNAPIPKLTFKMTTSDNKKISIVKPSKHPRHTSSDRDQPPSKKPMDARPSPKQPAYSAPVPYKPAPVEPEFSNRGVTTETISVGSSSGVGVVIDSQGNQVWICPGCNKPDDGSPMIGCDKCDGWYHWPCVGITQEPPEDQEWFCPSCRKKKKKVSKQRSSK